VSHARRRATRHIPRHPPRPVPGGATGATRGCRARARMTTPGVTGLSRSLGSLEKSLERAVFRQTSGRRTRFVDREKLGGCFQISLPSIDACLSFIAAAAFRDEAKRYQTNLPASSCHLSSAPLDNITPGAHLRAGPPRSPLCLRPWRRRP
jgi:hypothetical protein